MIRSCSPTVCAALLSIVTPAAAAEAPADLILSGGRVWTAKSEAPWAEAVAVRGDHIVYVGTDASAASLRGPKTEVVDLHGGLVLPGFNDAHIHLMEGALSLERVDLIEDDSLAAVQARIRGFAAANATRPWVLGRGWLYGSFPERIHNAPELSGRRASGIEFHTIMHTFHVTRPAHIAKPGQAAPRHLLGRPSPHVPASPPHAAMCWAMPR